MNCTAPLAAARSVRPARSVAPFRAPTIVEAPASPPRRSAPLSATARALLAVAWADGFLDLHRVAATLAVARAFRAPLPAQAFAGAPPPLDPARIPRGEQAAVVDAAATLALAIGSPGARETAAALAELVGAHRNASTARTAGAGAEPFADANASA